MAKKLLHSSKLQVDKANNLFVINDVIPLENILLITDVTANKVIYQFNSPTLGGTTVTDGQSSSTTLTVTHDMANDADIKDTDSFQFFYDSAEVHIEPSETFVDPVSKFRVSNPENLIDTDFEYGLQSTKWETIQTVNNVPTLYASGGEVPIEGITSVSSLVGSRQIRVQVTTPHGLTVGDPLSVQGVSDYQSEGFFIVSGTPSALEFFYEIDVEASVSGEISGSYTTIIPAKFFEGAQLNISNAEGVTTDEADQSVLTATTRAAHGFTSGTKLYIRNSIGPKELQIIDPTATATDGRPFVDTVASFQVDNQVQNTNTTRGGATYNNTVAWDWEMTHTKYLSYTDIGSSNQITWAGHGLTDRACVLFNTPVCFGGLNRDFNSSKSQYSYYYSFSYLSQAEPDESINYSGTQVDTFKDLDGFGLNDGEVYYVKVIDDNTLELYEFGDESLSNVITLTQPSQEFTSGLPRLGLVYEIARGGYNSNFGNSNDNWRWTRWNYEDAGLLSNGFNSGYTYSYDRYSYWAMSTYSPGWVDYNDEVTVTNIRLATSGLYYYYYYTRVGTPDNGQYTGNIGLYAWWYYGGREYYAYLNSVNNQASHFYNGAGIRTRQYKNHYGWMYHKGDIRRMTSGQATQDWSGKDLVANEYGAGISEPNMIVAFQGSTRGYRNGYYMSAGSSDYFMDSLSGDGAYKNRYGTTKQMNEDVTLDSASNDGVFVIANNFGFSYGFERYGLNQQAVPFYGFATKLEQTRNTIYIAGHEIPDQQTVTVKIPDAEYNENLSLPNNNVAGQTFLYADGYQIVEQSQNFSATVIKISDNVIKLQTDSFPNNDDFIEFPDNYTISYNLENEFYNTLFIQDHKIVGIEEGTYTAEGNTEPNPGIWNVTHQPGQYIFSGLRVSGTEVNPNIVVYRGSTYNFVVNATGHPFYLTTTDASGYVAGTYAGEYLLGVTNSRTDSGTLAWTVDASAPNTMYYFCGNHGTMNGTIEVRDVGAAIGGLTDNTDYKVIRVNDSRVSLSATASSTSQATTSNIGFANNSPQPATTIDVISPFSPAVPSEVTIDAIEYRGDFSGRYEYLVLVFGDGDTYYIGNINGQDTDQFRKETSFVSKNITSLLAGGTSINVDLYPTSQINYAHGSMSNWYEIRFVMSGGVGSVILSSTGSGVQKFSFDALAGAYDGIYEISGQQTSGSTFSMTSDIKIPKRPYTILNPNVDTTVNEITFATEHNFLLGEKVKYDPHQDTSYHFSTDIVSLDYYVYAIPVTDTKVAFATSETLAKENQRIPLATVAATGDDHLLRSESIIKARTGQGTVSLTQDSNEVVGNGTEFLKDFKRFDRVYIYNDTFNKEFTVSRVLTDNRLLLFENAENTVTSNIYFHPTELILRPDGYGIHLPFDGGVNITAGTSPDSKIVRQTRKYFRYQSGKGIQNSFAINFNPPKIVRILIKADGTTAEIETQEAHNLNVGDIVVIENAEVTVGNNEFNGEFAITTVVDAFKFRYTMANAPLQEKASGFPTYYLKNWNDSFVRAGMFDDQNGFFMQYDGRDLSCVRRSSTLQLAGTANVTRNSQVVTGQQTSFTTQLSVGSFVVIRGQSYKVVEIRSDIAFTVQPPYRGVDATQVKVTLTKDAVVKQNEWNLDRCDGTGPSGFDINVNRIQMAYADYSWYGAGKIRFGFKDRKGHVKYVHEFIHNNILDESYFRSGNLPGRYEITNGPSANAAPTLFHFGTSVIMDGTFDDDKAYLFTGNSKPFAFTNGNGDNKSTTGDSTFELITFNGQRVFVYAFDMNTSDVQDFKVGMLLSHPNLPEGTYVSQIKDVQGGTTKVYASYPATSTLPNIAQNPVITNGSGIDVAEDTNTAVDLSRPIPLISVRLAPSVDSSLTGDIGEREIMNRMQLGLRQAGVTSNRDLEVFVVLNPQPSNLDFRNVDTPSLSQVIEFNSGDTYQGGTVILATKVSAGSTTIDLSELLELGNSILGGDSVFPTGPDILTIAVQPQDTAGVNFTNPLQVTGKVSWSESQA